MRAVSSETLSVGAYASIAGDLAEVVDGVRGVGRAAADAQDEDSPVLRAGLHHDVDDRVDSGLVDPGRDLLDFLKVARHVIHGQTPERGRSAPDVAAAWLSTVSTASVSVWTSASA